MTRETEILNDTDLADVAGGVTSLIGTAGTIAKPHIPRDSELLTPQQIEKLLSLGGGFNPPPPKF